MEAAQRDAKLEAVNELIRLAVRAAEGGHWDSAAQYLDEASGTFQTIPAESPSQQPGKRDPRYLGLAGALSEGKGQLALRGGEIEEGAFHLETAIKMRLEEEAAGGTPPPLSLALALVNLTGAYHRLGKVEDSLRVNAQAIERLTPMELPPARIFLAAATEARGNLLSQLGRHDEALATFAAAVQYVTQLAAARIPGAPQLLTEIAVAHARAAMNASDAAEAMRLSHLAADVAWDRFE